MKNWTTKKAVALLLAVLMLFSTMSVFAIEGGEPEQEPAPAQGYKPGEIEAGLWVPAATGNDHVDLTKKVTARTGPTTWAVELTAKAKADIVNAPMEVVLVLDVSGSMADPSSVGYTCNEKHHIEGEGACAFELSQERICSGWHWPHNDSCYARTYTCDHDTEYHQEVEACKSASSRIADMKKAANKLIDELAAIGNVSVGLVKFAGTGTDDSDGRWGFTNGTRVLSSLLSLNDSANVTALKGIVSGLQSGGGTYTDKGISLGLAELKKGASANRNMILLSDGRPTYYTDGSGYKGNGSESGEGSASFASCAAVVKQEAKKVTDEGYTLFTIAFNATNDCKGLLSDIASAKPGEDAGKHAYESNSYSELLENFRNIKKAMIAMITDFMGKSYGVPTNLAVVVENTASGTHTVTDAEKKIEWNPEGGKLEAGKTVTMTYEVDLSEILTPTGANAGKFREETNEEAFLTYALGSSGASQDPVAFPKPEVLFETGNLQLVHAYKDVDAEGKPMLTAFKTDISSSVITDFDAENATISVLNAQNTIETPEYIYTLEAVDAGKVKQSGFTTEVDLSLGALRTDVEDATFDLALGTGNSELIYVYTRTPKAFIELKKNVYKGQKGTSTIAEAKGKEYDFKISYSDDQGTIKTYIDLPTIYTVKANSDALKVAVPYKEGRFYRVTELNNEKMELAGWGFYDVQWQFPGGGSGSYFYTPVPFMLKEREITTVTCTNRYVQPNMTIHKYMDENDPAVGEEGLTFTYEITYDSNYKKTVSVHMDKGETHASTDVFVDLLRISNQEDPSATVTVKEVNADLTGYKRTTLSGLAADALVAGDAVDVLMTYEGEDKAVFFSNAYAAVGSLKITKTITGLTMTADEGIEFELEKETAPNTYTSVGFYTFAVNAGTQKGELVIPDLEPGNYKLTETKPDDIGLHTWDSGSSTSRFKDVTIAAGETTTQAFTNHYVPSTRDLVVSKTVAWVGTPPSADAQPQNFAFHLYDGNTPLRVEWVADGTYRLVASDDPDATIRINVKAGGSVTIQGLSVGKTYQVVEMNPGTWTNFGYPLTTYSTEGGYITIGESNNAVAITNTYTRQNAIFKVEKDVAWNGPAGQAGPFAFELYDVTNNRQLYLNGANGVYTATPDATYAKTFSLADGEVATITAEAGIEFKVTELATNLEAQNYARATTVTLTGGGMVDKGSTVAPPSVRFITSGTGGIVSFNNIYTRETADLQVTKEVAWVGTKAEGDIGKFQFSLYDENNNLVWLMPNVGGGYTVGSGEGTVSSFELGDGGSVLVKGLNKGATYRLVEVEKWLANFGYPAVTYSKAGGSITIAASDNAVLVTNTYTRQKADLAINKVVVPVADGVFAAPASYKVSITGGGLVEPKEVTVVPGTTSTVELEVGLAYTITEDVAAAQVDDYSLATYVKYTRDDFGPDDYGAPQSAVTATLVTGDTVTFTNVYARLNGTLRLYETVDLSGSIGSIDDLPTSYQVTVKNKAGTPVYEETFTVTKDIPLAIDDIPVGAYTVTQTNKPVAKYDNYVYADEDGPGEWPYVGNTVSAVVKASEEAEAAFLNVYYRRVGFVDFGKLVSMPEGYEEFQPETFVIDILDPLGNVVETVTLTWDDSWGGYAPDRYLFLDEGTYTARERYAALSGLNWAVAWNKWVFSESSEVSQGVELNESGTGQDVPMVIEAWTDTYIEYTNTYTRSGGLTDFDPIPLGAPEIPLGPPLTGDMQTVGFVLAALALAALAAAAMVLGKRLRAK